MNKSKQIVGIVNGVFTATPGEIVYIKAPELREPVVIYSPRYRPPDNHI